MTDSYPPPLTTLPIDLLYDTFYFLGIASYVRPELKFRGKAFFLEKINRPARVRFFDIQELKVKLSSTFKKKILLKLYKPLLKFLFLNKNSF